MSPYYEKPLTVIILVLQNIIVRGTLASANLSKSMEHVAIKRSSVYYDGVFLTEEKLSPKAPSFDFSASGVEKYFNPDGLLNARYFANIHSTDIKCSVDKIAFNHEGIVSYEQNLPSLQQLTLCAWMRFTNHSGDHTIITYAVQNEPREIQLWIANTPGMSFISLAIHGQSLFRLNYPFKIRHWHHVCASWNGKTGEWQLWIKAERVGRGFHNRLVEYEIKPNGKLYSGGSSVTGPTDTDLHFELTMVQIYKVALSAGKAHRDHKHHHVHHFDHNGRELTPATPKASSQSLVIPANPLLANGQIPTRFKINLADGQTHQSTGNLGLPVKGVPSQLVGGFVPSNAATITTQFVSGQFHVGERNLQRQLAIGNILDKSKTNAGEKQITSDRIVFPVEVGEIISESFNDLNNPANAQIIDKTNQQKYFKRESNSKKKVLKRGLLFLKDGTILNENPAKNSEYKINGLAEFGLPNFKNKLGKETDIEGEIREHDSEPAEGEVSAIMNVCTKCDEEPFTKAIVFAWNDLRVHMAHALRAKASVICGQF
ncbi:uncharacterized protein LOC131693880 [Topomyia yanbarensis]|uniref:uncharacterized protein LOC131693880 n=1 Tax=Topomyia yanbarensis TaxID=2498891 RepID=UPI00273B40FC|nr:uncharacterized protein LOC131693880 [Topomyia yanbarensis]